ncbi:hypothetical protein BpHYR1_040632 [Brachionus plicatilis]|uniref:Uncharacterized protein n=1 Tax=Brachionus plicatilis TaxID=10195 RepID=A0A3M7RYW3_BRAPC|nr:hypothetical protein BpHYR1_040632 [Brachionus plicatilis]
MEAWYETQGKGLSNKKIRNIVSETIYFDFIFEKSEKISIHTSVGCGQDKPVHYTDVNKIDR